VLVKILTLVKDNVASLFRYLTVGLIVYGVEYFLYLILVGTVLVSPLYANAQAKVVAGLLAYILHRVHSFKKDFHDGLLRDLAKYIGVLAINIPLFGAVFYAVSLVSLDYKTTKLIADVFCIGIAYLQARLIIFNQSSR
jgi:putative flippase GtrA